MTRLIPFACMALLFWSCTPSAKYMLTFHPIQGETYHYVVSEVTHTVSTENGQKVGRNQNVFVAFRCRLKDKQTNGVTIGMDEFSLHEQKDGQAEKNVSVNGARTDLSCDLDQTGGITGIIGLENMYAQLDPSWRQRFGEGYFARLMGKGWGTFPGASVREGDTWDGLDSLNADPRIPVATRYTLLKNRGGILLIKTDADVDLSNTALAGTTHGGQLTLKGRQRGVWRIDALTGMVLGGQTVLQAEGTLTTIKGTIPMYIDSTCSVNVPGA